MGKSTRLLATSLVVIIVLVASAASLAFAVAGTPGSDPSNGSWVGGLQLSPGPEQLVLWHLPGSGGRLGTCIYANANGPLTGPYSKRATIDDAVFGELNHLYATASTSDVRIAELSALNSHKYDRVDKALQWSYVANGQGGMSVADSNSMIARATALAGPYTVAVSWPQSDTAAETPYEATLTVISASGAPVPGALVSLGATNAALSATSATTSGSGRATVGFRIPAGTSSTFTISASVQSWTRLDVFQSAGEQDMLVAGAPDTQSGQHTGPVTRTRTVDLVKVDASDPMDTPVAGYTFQITDASGSVVDAAVSTATSPSAAPLGSLVIGQTYYAKEIGVPAGARLYIPVQASMTFTVPPGLGPWVLVAKDPAVPTPTISTQVDVANAIAGQELTDDVIVAGDDGEDATIRATLYGPIAPPPSGTCSDLTLAQYFAAASQQFDLNIRGSDNLGNGVHRVIGPIVARSGCWGWAETLTLTPSGASASSPPTAPHESTLVTTPQVATTASAQVAAPGYVLDDRVLVTGMNGQSGTLVATLYGPLPAASGCRYLDATWRAAIGSSRANLVAGSTTTRVVGDGTYITAPVTLTRLGCYTYRESLTPDSVPTSPVSTAYGLPTESTVVLTPAITTTASVNSVDSGQAVRDRVTISGTSGVSAIVTGDILGPMEAARPLGQNPASSTSCGGLNWAHAPIAATLAPTPVNGDATYVTPEIRLVAAGCYTFAQSLFVHGVPTPIVAALAGIPAETVAVRTPPSITSTPSTPTLARTGTPTLALGISGVAALVIGGLLTSWGRRRPR